MGLSPEIDLADLATFLAAVAALAAAFLAKGKNLICLPFFRTVFNLSGDLSPPRTFFDLLWEGLEAMFEPWPSLVVVDAWSLAAAKDFFVDSF